MAEPVVEGDPDLELRLLEREAIAVFQTGAELSEAIRRARALAGATAA